MSPVSKMGAALAGAGIVIIFLALVIPPAVGTGYGAVINAIGVIIGLCFACIGLMIIIVGNATIRQTQPVVNHSLSRKTIIIRGFIIYGAALTVLAGLMLLILIH